MASQIQTGAVNHMTLTVTNVERSVEWYTRLLGFQVAMSFGERVILSNGGALVVLGPPPHAEQSIPDDSFNENRVGLDHVSFNVGSHADLEAAMRLFDENGVSHGEIKDLGPDLGFYVLAFRDPDNVQLELTAPYG